MTITTGNPVNIIIQKTKITNKLSHSQRYEGCTNDSEGIGSEMERLAARMGGSVKFPFNKSECLDADFFKIVADHLIRESGVRPLLHCLAVEVIKEGEVVRGIVTESKSGRQAILADRVIDCTGDADIAYLAGARCTRVRIGNNLLNSNHIF